MHDAVQGLVFFLHLQHQLAHRLAVGHVERPVSHRRSQRFERAQVLPAGLVQCAPAGQHQRHAARLACDFLSQQLSESAQPPGNQVHAVSLPRHQHLRLGRDFLPAGHLPAAARVADHHVIRAGCILGQFDRQAVAFFDGDQLADQFWLLQARGLEHAGQPVQHMARPCGRHHHLQQHRPRRLALDNGLHFGAQPLHRNAVVGSQVAPGCQLDAARAVHRARHGGAQHHVPLLVVRRLARRNFFLPVRLQQQHATDAHLPVHHPRRKAFEPDTYHALVVA